MLLLTQLIDLATRVKNSLLKLSINSTIFLIYTYSFLFSFMIALNVKPIHTFLSHPTLFRLLYHLIKCHSFYLSILKGYKRSYLSLFTKYFLYFCKHRRLFQSFCCYKPCTSYFVQICYSNPSPSLNHYIWFTSISRNSSRY